MNRIITAALGAIVILALVAAGWYYRPWSPYSPARMTALDNPEEYPTTYQRMDEILPATEIRATNPAPLPENIQPLSLTYEWEGETKTLETYFEEARITGFTILHEGVLVAEAYGHGATSESRHTSWSVGKSFVATLIAKALEEGLITSLDDPVERYAPQYAGTDYGPTSLRHLLMMSTGMDFNEEYRDDAPSDVRPLFFNAFILRRNPDDMIGEIERDREPGQDNHYISPNSHVLAAVVRGVYEGRLAEIMERELWGPLGMTSNASWLQHKPGPEGVAIGYCCLQATSRDYARFGQFYLENGSWNGEQILPETWVDEASVPPAPFMEPGATRYNQRGYGLHFWIPVDYDGEFFAAGVFGQYIWIDRRRNLVIAQNAGDPVWGPRYPEAATVFRALAEQIAPLSTAEAELAVEPTDLADPTPEPQQ